MVFFGHALWPAGRDAQTLGDARQVGPRLLSLSDQQPGVFSLSSEHCFQLHGLQGGFEF